MSNSKESAIHNFEFWILIFELLIPVVFTIEVSILAMEADSIKRGSTLILEIVSLSRINLSQ